MQVNESKQVLCGPAQSRFGEIVGASGRGTRPPGTSLAVAGVDVAGQVKKGSLSLSSDPCHLQRLMAKATPV
jgi:hypothetical protein